MTRLDSRLLIETSEGVDLEVAPAGPVSRALAYALDAVIRVVILLGIALSLRMLGDFGEGLLLIAFFLLEWLYPVLCEGLWGATPGKRWMRLRVVTREGLPPSWAAAVLRNLLRAVDFLPLLYVTGLFSLLLSRHFQRLGDLAANTLVVHAPPVAAGERPLDLPPAPLGWPMNGLERQALLDFGARSAQLSVQRQQELAGLFATAIGTDDGEICRQRLLGGAASLIGPGELQSEQESSQ